VSILAFYAGSEKALSDFLGYSISKYRFWINKELVLFVEGLLLFLAIMAA